MFWALKNIKIINKITTRIIIILGVHIYSLFLALYGDLSFKLAFKFLVLNIDGYTADCDLSYHQLNEHFDAHGNEGATLVKGLASDENYEKGYQNEEIELLMEELEPIKHLI